MYGHRATVVLDDGETFSFDVGEILWALGTGAITGAAALLAAQAWIHVVCADRDPLSLARGAAAAGLPAAEGYGLAGQKPKPEDLPGIARELIDAGVLPPPPGRRR